MDIAKIRSAFEEYEKHKYTVFHLFDDSKNNKIWATMLNADGKGLDVSYELDIKTGDIRVRDHFDLMDALIENGAFTLDEALLKKCIY